MSARRNPKPRPVFRLVFFMVGLYFGWESYLGIVRPELSGSYWGCFQHLALYPGLALFFCWNMALRSSAGWNFLPRWMMTERPGRTDPGDMSPLDEGDQQGDTGRSP